MHQTRPELCLGTPPLDRRRFPRPHLCMPTAVTADRSLRRPKHPRTSAIVNVHPHQVASTLAAASTFGSQGTHSRPPHPRPASFSQGRAPALLDARMGRYVCDSRGRRLDVRPVRRACPTVDQGRDKGLYYGAGRERLLEVRPGPGTTSSKRHPLSIFYSTLLDLDAREILSTYTGRWSIEVTIEDGKQLLASRTRQPPSQGRRKRTAPDGAWYR